MLCFSSPNQIRQSYIYIIRKTVKFCVKYLKNKNNIMSVGEIERQRERDHMYSAMTFSVVSLRFRLMRSERTDMATLTGERREFVGILQEGFSVGSLNSGAWITLTT